MTIWCKTFLCFVSFCIVFTVNSDQSIDKIVDYFNEQPNRLECYSIVDKTPMSNDLALNWSRYELGTNFFNSYQNLFNMMTESILRNNTQLILLLTSYLDSNSIVVEMGLYCDGQLYVARRDFGGRIVNYTLNDTSNSLTKNSSGGKLIKYLKTFNQNRMQISSSLITVLWQQYCSGDNLSDRQWRIIFLFTNQTIQQKSQYKLNVSQMPMFYIGLPLDSIDLNQCDADAKDADDGPLFEEIRGTHGCHKNLTTCVQVPKNGFKLGGYKCCCQSDQKRCFNGSQIEEQRSSTGGAAIDIQTQCGKAEFIDIVDYTMRTVLLSITVLCAMVAFAMIFVAMTQRNMQDWTARGWALMELFLFGAILLYCLVVLEYFSPRELTCCLITWCRELGFVLFYGTVVLKICRNLIENRVRRANRSYVKEKELLKYLCCMLAFTLTGLIAWTLTAVESTSLQDGGVQSVLYTTWPTVKYPVCTIFKWNLAWNGLEYLLLLYGCYLSYKAKNTSWFEKRQFAFAIALEMVVSLIVNIIRYNVWRTAGPNLLFVLTFVQIHLTVTVIVITILASTFYYTYTSIDHNNRTHSFVGSAPGGKAHPSLARLRDNLMNGTIDFADVPIGEMNPEDIKAELKRVYTQLRMYKLTNLYVDNPHISKRKGGKKTSNKQTPRRFSVPANASKSQKEQLKKWEAEERSSLMKTSDDEPVVNPSDLTIQSSSHNAYLSRNSLAASKKIQLDSDLSVRI